MRKIKNKNLLLLYTVEYCRFYIYKCCILIIKVKWNIIVPGYFVLRNHVEYFIFYRNLRKKKLTNYIFKYFLTFLHLLQIYYFFQNIKYF